MTRGLRKLHTWVGLIAGIPFFIMITTALLIGNGSWLKLNRFQVHAGWLPAYRRESSAPALLHAALFQNGSQLLGTNAGLFVRSNTGFERVRELGNADVRVLLRAADAGVLAATSKGLWSNATGSWKLLLKGDVQNLSLGDANLVAITKRRGVQVSRDGGATWVVSPKFRMPTVQSNPAVTLPRLITDLHSGRLFFGARGSWIWVNIVALGFAVMVCSGVYGFYRTRRTRSKARAFALAKANATA